MPYDFHERAYDEGTLAKLRIFELYAQEWIPVFLNPKKPFATSVHLFDFFCGPGTDSKETYGSPLRLLNQLRRYQKLGLALWGKIPIVVHFSDSDARKVQELESTISAQE